MNRSVARHRSARLSPASVVLAALSKGGQPGRVLSPQIDRMRTGGLRTILRELRTSGRDEAQRLSANHTETYRRIWKHAADELGAEMEQLHDGFVVIRSGTRETLVWRHLVMMDHPSTTAFALNKTVVHQLLSNLDVPVPEHVELDRTQRSAAMEFIEQAPPTVPGHVVKPAAGTSGGAGVTCNVRTPEDLLRAWLGAGRWEGRILVERQAPGDEYRLLFLDGQLLGAVRRKPASVQGDGTSTVGQLIDAENRRRLSLASAEVARLVRVDLDCALALSRQGLTLGSVPSPGRRVAVKGTVSQNAVADNETVGDVSPELVAQCAAAARAMRLRLAGVDVVSPDISVPLHASGGVVLEVNGTPGFHYHYQVADPGRMVPVAVPILEELLKHSRGGTIEPADAHG